MERIAWDFFHKAQLFQVSFWKNGPKTTPLKFNMVHLKINPGKEDSFLETIIFRFHVKLWGCKLYFPLASLWYPSHKEILPSEVNDLFQGFKLFKDLYSVVLGGWLVYPFEEEILRTNHQDFNGMSEFWVGFHRSTGFFFPSLLGRVVWKPFFVEGKLYTVVYP